MNVGGGAMRCLWHVIISKYFKKGFAYKRKQVKNMTSFFNRKSRHVRKAMGILACLAMMLSTIVAVPVDTLADDDYIMLDIIVYFNDSTAACYDYVLGEQVKVTEPGTYTLTFDCAQHLTYEQTSAGVTGLNNLGAIYIVDNLYFEGVSVSSAVESFDFTYDSVVVDGTEIELSNHDERSGLKSAGQVDTNGPINAWEDCQLADGTYEIDDSYCLNLVDFEDPQVIEITFTITNMEFKVTETEEETEEETDTEAAEEDADDDSETEEVAETEEETEDVDDTEAATDADTADDGAAAETEAETTTEAAEDDDSGNSTMRIIIVVVVVIALIVVIIIVAKKLGGNK